MNITIEWLSDSSECDSCGWSYADGARVTFDDGTVLDLEPSAYCCGPTDYSTVDVFTKILEHLGHKVEVVQIEP